MKLPLLVSTLVALRSSAHSPDSVTVRDVLTTKNHFEFGISRGFTRPGIYRISGPLQAYKITGRVFSADFTYSCNISSKFAAWAALKAGAYPMQLGIPKTAVSAGTDIAYMYFQETDYTPFAELACGASLNQVLSNKYVLRGMLGGGFKFTGESYFSSSYHTDKSTSVSGFSLESNAAIKPFIVIRTGAAKKLRNHDLLGLSIAYYRSFKDIFSGEYFIARSSSLYSYGTLRYKGHEFSLGISYTFTGYEKKLKYDAARKSATITKKESRRQQKREYFEKRAGNNNSIRGYGGLFAVNSTAQYANRPVTSSTDVEGGGGMDFIREFHPRYFWEAGWNLQEYFTGYGINYNGTRYSVAWNLFHGLQASGGAGYILRNRRFIPQLHISAGAAIVFNVDGNGKGYYSSGALHTGSLMNGKFLDFTSDDYMLHTVFPLVYLGIRKDIQLRHRLFLSMAVRRHQGLYKIYTSKIVYKTTETGPQEFNTSVFMRGSYTLFSLGFKVDL